MLLQISIANCCLAAAAEVSSSSSQTGEQNILSARLWREASQKPPPAGNSEEKDLQIYALKCIQMIIQIFWRHHRSYHLQDIHIRSLMCRRPLAGFKKKRAGEGGWPERFFNEKSRKGKCFDGFSKEKKPREWPHHGFSKEKKVRNNGFQRKETRLRGMVPWAFKRKSEKSRKREWGLQKKR